MNEIAPTHVTESAMPLCARSPDGAPAVDPGPDPALCARAPIGMLCELTHRCPLQCPYCSNPVELERVNTELTTAEWQDIMRQAAQLGVLQIVAQGEGRFRILERSAQADGLARARVEPVADDADGPVPPGAARCARLLERVIADTPGMIATPHRLDSASWVGMRLAELLPLPLESKQELLEMTDALARVYRLAGLLSRAAGV